MPRSYQNSPIKLLADIWRRLTAPQTSIEEPGYRRQARLLSSMLIALILLTTLLVIVPPQRNPSFYVAVGIAAVFAVAYGLNRTGRYAPAAFIAVTTLSGGTWMSIRPSYRCWAIQIRRPCWWRT